MELPPPLAVLYSPLRMSLPLSVTRRSAIGSLLAIPASAQPPSASPRANRFHIAFLGDRNGGAEPQIYGRIWREIDMLGPDLVVNVGDTIPGGHQDETLDQQWKEFRAIRKRYSRYPLYFTPGNHDIWSPASEVAFRRETGFALNYGFDFQNARFVVLDTSRSEKLTSAQLDFLEEDLSAHRASNPKFVLFHHPYWIQALESDAAGFRLHQIARRYGVGHIISGHGHRFFRKVRDGVTYLEVGSSGGTMRGKLLHGEGFAQGCFYHFVWGSVEGDEVRLVVKELDGMGGQGRMFRVEDWDESGPRFDISDPALSAHPET